jgi:hypothetical protein
MAGTLSYEDIYGAGSLDTLPADSGETQQKANPNNSEVTGNTANKSLFNISGSILGQPIIVYIGLILLLVGAKWAIEVKKVI